MLEICRRDWQRRRIFSDGEKPFRPSAGLRTILSSDHLYSEMRLLRRWLILNYRSLATSNNVYSRATTFTDPKSLEPET
jgi:hypothetical protein